MAKAAAKLEYKTRAEARVVREKRTTIIDRALDAICEKHGRVTVDDVLASARTPKSPLHKFFEWDDSRAGEQWRRHQALNMIQASKFVVTLTEAKSPPDARGERVEVRRLVSAFRGEGFRMRAEALSDAEARANMIERKLSELRSWCRSTIDIEELAPLRSAIEAQLK